MVPIVLLTGFLGSGKTTLLNRLFRERPAGGGRFAIIVNEFGDVGIDGDLLPQGATRQVELPGGCVCCALVTDLQDALMELLAAEPELECIILETTGVADPMPISWTLGAEPLAGRVRLASVITVVDPFEHERSRPLSPSVDAQVRFADVLVVSKLDRCDPAEPPAALVRGLREHNQVAPLIQELPDLVAPTLWALIDDPAIARPRVPPAHAHTEEGSHTNFEVVSVDAPDTYDLEELVSALEDLPSGVIRAKGIVCAVDGESGSETPALYVIHRVGARVSTEPFGGRAPTRLILLGRGLDSGHIDACLRSAVLPS